MQRVPREELFRELWATSPGAALARYALTAGERMMLLGLLPAGTVSAEAPR